MFAPNTAAAHARKKFKAAYISQKRNKVTKAGWAINHIQKLYRIEKQIKGLNVDEKLIARQAQSIPLLLQFKDWLDKAANQALPKTALGRAVQYCLNQWHKLQHYADNGELSIDNNRPEREAKAFAVGRKNWLFANTGNGAETSSKLYSLVHTAIANGLDPQAYIQHLLNKLCRLDEKAAIDDLLPWRVQLYV